MSLATTGGGGGLGGAGGAGGLVMGHDASGGAGALQNTAAPPPPPTAGPDATGTASAPTASAIEVCDKTQKGITLSLARTTAHLPITAVDLYAAMPTVALFPPAAAADDGDEDDVSPVFLGKMKAKLGFYASEASHKTLRKFLTQSKPYAALKQDSLATKWDDNAKDVVVVDRPHLWLGVRRVPQLQPAWLSSQFTTDASSEAIAPSSTDVGCCWTNSTLDGSVPHKTLLDYDMDRVVAKVRLVSTKKALTVLPEEATQLVLHQAQSHVSTKYAKLKDELTRFPLSLAVPSYALNDATMEALYEAASVGGGGAEGDAAATPTVLFARSICAVMGSFVKPDPPNGHQHQQQSSNNNLFRQRLATVQQALMKQHKLMHGGHANKEAFVGATLVIAMGCTPEACEVSAIQCLYPTNEVPYVMFEEFQMLANVSQFVATALDKPAETLLDSCLSDLHAILDMVAPDVDGPALVLTYGTSHEQDALADALQKYKKRSGNGTAAWLQKVPVIAASPEAVPTGAALLGGLALGRLQDYASDGGASLPVRLQTVATVATGVTRYYTTSQAQAVQKVTPNNAWPQPEHVKTVFDFDRRLPAGPYGLEFKASECVVHRQRLLSSKNGSNSSSTAIVNENDEAFLKAVKEAEASKKIPEREKAALEFTIQVYQKCTRNGPWQPVGNPMAPLVKYDTPIDEKTDEDQAEVKIACEQVTLELSMAVTGTLTTRWDGERESVVQAVKSARGRLYEWYGWTAFCLVFFGGFFCKSYYEDYVWKRDTQRLLDYYAHVIPNSTQDGDADTASWLAYKYRHKKQQLWDNLEQKYGVPIPLDGVWPEEAVVKPPEEPEEVDLDAQDDENKPKTEEGGEAEAAAAGRPDEVEEPAASDAAAEAGAQEETTTEEVVPANDQVTDAVTQSDVKVVGEAPANNGDESSGSDEDSEAAAAADDTPEEAMEAAADDDHDATSADADNGGAAVAEDEQTSSEQDSSTPPNEEATADEENEEGEAATPQAEAPDL